MCVYGHGDVKTYTKAEDGESVARVELDGRVEGQFGRHDAWDGAE